MHVRALAAPARRCIRQCPQIYNSIAQRCLSTPTSGLAIQSDSAVDVSKINTSSAPTVSTPADTSLERSSSSGLPALPSDTARVRDIVFKGPIAEDAEGGARYESTVSTFWSNIPQHVRASFTAPSSTDDAPRSSVPMYLDSVVSNAKALVASTGFAPASWNPNGDATPYYGGRIALAPYKKGQTAAYHYPRVLVPREMANRFPLDMYVDPVFQTSDPAQRLRQRGDTLFNRLQGKTTLLLIFSAQPLSGLWTGLRHWLGVVGQDFNELPNSQVFKLHCEEGWFNRRTSALTKFHIRRQVDESEMFTTFVYKGKWKWEYVYNLHHYNKQLPVVLLLDHLGYIRWHAVGLPTEDATALFRSLSHKLAHEKRRHL